LDKPLSPLAMERLSRSNHPIFSFNGESFGALVVLFSLASIGVSIVLSRIPFQNEDRLLGEFRSWSIEVEMASKLPRDDGRSEVLGLGLLIAAALEIKAGRLGLGLTKVVLPRVFQ
jgi:hypothetical protein